MVKKNIQDTYVYLRILFSDQKKKSKNSILGQNNIYVCYSDYICVHATLNLRWTMLIPLLIMLLLILTLPFNKISLK